MTLRERFGNWIGGKRAEQIAFGPEFQGLHFGNGLGSNQPDTSVLLKENVGVPDMATRAIANRLGSLNPQVKVSLRDGAGTLVDEVLDDHVLKVLLDRPHPNFTRQQLLRLTAQFVVTSGEAYWLKIRNGFDLPAMLQPMPPQNVSPIVQGGVIERYAVRNSSGATVVLPGSEVIRFYWPDPETLYSGEGYLGPNATNTDAARFADQHLRSRYQNDATPPIVLKGGADATPTNDEQWTRWQDDWRRKYHSRAGTHKGLPAMLPPGWDAIVMALSSGADITPLLEHWQAQQLMNFGTPQSILGRVVSGDRSSAETNQFVFDRHTILPIATMIAETLSRDLAEEFDPALFVAFEDFVSADKEHVLKQEDQDLRLKVRSVQQIIEDRGRDLEKAPWGELPVGSFADTPYTGEAEEFDFEAEDPAALFDPEEDAEEETPDEPRRRTRSQLRSHFAPDAEWERQKFREKKFTPAFLKAMRSILRDQKDSVIRKLEDQMPRARVSASDIFNPDEWIDLFDARVERVRRLTFVEILRDTLAGLGTPEAFVFGAAQQKVLKKQGALLVQQVNDTTRKRIRKSLVEGNAAGEGVDQIAKRIRGVFSTRRAQARTIARTEVLKASQTAQLEGFESSGVVERKQWNDNRDPEVRDAHIASIIAIVDTRDPFTLGDGERADAPGIGEGGSALSAANAVNCRCFVTPVFEE